MLYTVTRFRVHESNQRDPAGRLLKVEQSETRAPIATFWSSKTAQCNTDDLAASVGGISFLWLE